MSKFGQNVNKKLCRKHLILILNNFFNKQFGKKSIIGVNFLIYCPSYEQIQNDVILGGKYDALCQNLDKMWKKIVPKTFNSNFEQLF